MVLCFRKVFFFYLFEKGKKTYVFICFFFVYYGFSIVEVLRKFFLSVFLIFVFFSYFFVLVKFKDLLMVYFCKFFLLKMEIGNFIIKIRLFLIENYYVLIIALVNFIFVNGYKY